MKIAGRTWLPWPTTLLVCAHALACSSATSDSDRCTSQECLQQSITAEPPPTPGGEAGGPAPIAAGFGNSSMMSNVDDLLAPPAPVDPNPMTSMPTGPCEEGVFCPLDSLDGNKCGTLRIDSSVEITVQPGNLLIIFDMSGSMGDLWLGLGTNKRDAARQALEAAITPLQDQLNVGAIFFPTVACVPLLPPPPGGAVAPITDGTQINFAPGPQFMQTWNQRWSIPALDGIGTPMNEAFDRAAVALENANLTGQTAVVVFTDGAPTCFPDANVSGVPTMPEPQRAASWLNGDSVKTYVVGLPGAAGVQVLNQVAQSGGTGTYILPDDPAQLEEKLREVVQETVKRGFDNCSITLNPAAELPDDLLMLVTENGVEQTVPRDRGWTLSADGAHVEITGKLCDDAMGGRFESITFEYFCPEDPPPPPLPPIE